MATSFQGANGYGAMAGYSAFQGSPVTQQAVVSVNAGFDRLFSNYRKGLGSAKTVLSSADDHVFTVQQRELVFRLNPRFDKLINRPMLNGINDLALKVFSSCNNWPKPGNIGMSFSNGRPMSDDAARRAMVTFVGVAVTPVDFMNTNQKDNLAVQVAGSCTIYNTGSKPIRAGQKVIWDFGIDETKEGTNKRKRISGQPSGKVHFQVLPLEAAFGDADVTKATATDFVSFLMSYHKHIGPNPATTEEAASLAKSIASLVPAGGIPAGSTLDTDAMKTYLRKVLVMYEEVRSRVIGIALSGAAPGEQFDIMLASSH